MPPMSSEEVKAAKIGALSTRAAATIGAAAVLLAAVSSVVAALLSADRAADATLENTSVQLAGETDRSRAEFLRTQRQLAYSAFMTDALRLSGLLDAPITSPEHYVMSNTDVEAVSDAKAAMEGSFSGVSILATGSAKSTASEYHKTLVEAYQHAQYLYCWVQGERDGEAFCASVPHSDIYKDAFSKSAAAASQFGDAASKQLGVD